MDENILRVSVLSRGGFAKYLADYITANPKILNDFEAVEIDLNIATLEAQKADLDVRLTALQATKADKEASIEAQPLEEPTP
jgi:hypothetical protein